MEFLIPAVKDLNGEGKSNEIVGDDSNDESDSDTTSADETHIQKTEIKKKLKEELPSSPTDDNGVLRSFPPSPRMFTVKFP